MKIQAEQKPPLPLSRHIEGGRGKRLGIVGQHVMQTLSKSNKQANIKYLKIHKKKKSGKLLNKAEWNNKGLKQQNNRWTQKITKISLYASQNMNTN